MKIIVFLADGFEEVEALTVVDYLRRMNIEVDTLSIRGEKQVRGAHDIVVLADKTIGEIEGVEGMEKTKEYDGLVIPGGLPGATNLRDEPRVIEMVKEIYGQDKLVAAICAGPIVLQKAGVIKGKRVTSYPGFQDQLPNSIYEDKSVVRDGNIITSRGPSLAVDFAIEIVKYLLGDEKASELKDGILYKG